MWYFNVYKLQRDDIMKILVIGCGKIGTTLIDSLIIEGHDIVAIDSNADVLQGVTNIYDVMSVCGNGCDCDTLSEAGAENADLVISVTDSDELNLLSCFLARRMGAKHTVARVRNTEYNDKNISFMRHQLEVSMIINPDKLAAQELYNLLKLPSAVKVETFSTGRLEMVELVLKPESVLCEMKLMDIRKKYPFKFLVCAVERDGEVYIPSGDFKLQSGDKIGIVASQSEIIRLFKTVESIQRQAHDVMILGASRTAFYLSEKLISTGSEVKIIERDRERCEKFSEFLPEAVIIQGDGAQQELLTEEGISSMSAFVSLTGMDEENILISYFATSQNVPKVVTKINRDEFFPLARKMGLESIISPKKTVSDVLVRYARSLQNAMGSKIETLYNIMDAKAEAIEFIVPDDCKFVGVPLKELKLKPNTLVAGIIRGRKPIIPSGDDVIEVNDRVIIFSSGRKLNDLSEIVK